MRRGPAKGWPGASGPRVGLIASGSLPGLCPHAPRPVAGRQYTDLHDARRRVPTAARSAHAREREAERNVAPVVQQFLDEVAEPGDVARSDPPGEDHERDPEHAVPEHEPAAARTERLVGGI